MTTPRGPCLDNAAVLQEDERLGDRTAEARVQDPLIRLLREEWGPQGVKTSSNSCAVCSRAPKTTPNLEATTAEEYHAARQEIDELLGQAGEVLGIARRDLCAEQIRSLQPTGAVGGATYFANARDETAFRSIFQTTGSAAPSFGRGGANLCHEANQVRELLVILAWRECEDCLRRDRWEMEADGSRKRAAPPRLYGETKRAHSAQKELAAREDRC